jgi:6-phosphogluconolactonase/glucosamine-6-phosphate isomerase/deaminase
MSVFPGSEAFDRTDWALAIPAPTHVEPHVPRVTLNPAVLGVARTVLMVTTGESKAEIVERVFTAPRDPRQLPAQLVRNRAATWILDEAAASRLPPAVRRAG